ncbi:uncharacterized protein PAC_14507 [Phialocephala subalpina]|uniref:Nephrocystin 3-like N-terminal domain-containing protein n=1 Tax=Phialocephala subalpina TaxID=576137 RepID=A0A1L7XHT5_9HELO|nr:uncharacterized protein PAC_14507 [Phialocephala subalpina]
MHPNLDGSASPTATSSTKPPLPPEDDYQNLHCALEHCANPCLCSASALNLRQVEMSNTSLPLQLAGHQKPEKKSKKPSLLDRIRLRGRKAPQSSNAGSVNLEHSSSVPSSSAASSTGTFTSKHVNGAQTSAGTTTSGGLWLKALEKLSGEDREAIKNLQPKPENQHPFSKANIDELLDLTKHVQTKCQESSLKLSFGGKDIIVRDVAGKIIFWLSKFKEIGDVTVSCDPVHAALPWAGVRFLLQATIGEHEQMGNLVLATEKISYLISRGAIYERLYPPGECQPLSPHEFPTTAWTFCDFLKKFTNSEVVGSGTMQTDVESNFHDAMIELYATILRMIALCHRLFAKNTAKRAVHALFQPGDVSTFLEQSTELENRVEHEVQNCERSDRQRSDAETRSLLALLKEPIVRTDEGVLKLLEKTEERERLRILDWISKVLYGSNHRTVTEKRTMDTCEWLLKHQKYEEWQNASASITFWLSGNPGTGKTFLTSKVIDRIQATLDNNPNQEGFAFFYCNRNEAKRREPLSALRTFVRQLSTIASEEELMQKNLKRFYSEQRLKASEPTMSDCKNILLELINIYPRTTLVLDALDECEKGKRVELIEVFDYLLAHASNPLKIFISSRPDLDIKRKLRDRTNIEIQANDNHHDITKFVDSEITKHPEWHTMDSTLKDQIVTTLQERSQGMFQWAFLQIKQLLVLDLRKDILDRLGKLPKDLKQSYDEIYNAMGEAEKRIADRAFQWVMCACHPLQTTELLPAVCQDGISDILEPLGGLTEDLVLKYCHNLLVIDPVRKVWIPSHLSVIEYFEDHLWNQSQANCLVGTVCLLVLQNTVLYNRERSWGNPKKQIQQTIEQKELELNDPLQDQGFQRLSYYVRHHWPIHAQKSSEIDNNNRLSTLLEDFLGLPTESSPAYRCWHRTIESDEYKTPNTGIFSSAIDYYDLSPASIAAFAYCAFGLAEILPDWHNYNWVKDDNGNQHGESFLELAARSGYIPTCRLLIRYGAEINAQTKSGSGSALATVAFWGRKDIVEYLVKEEGAEVNMQLQYGEFGSALAAAGRKGDKEIVEYLVKKGGAEVNMHLKYGEYGSALAAAAYGGEKDTVEYLVKEEGAEVNMQLQYGEYGSALAAAGRKGDKEIVEYLVKEGGAEVNMQLQYGRYGSALAAAAAASWGEKEIVEYLVKEGGAEVNMQLQYGSYGSALVAATFYGVGGTVEYLVKEGGAEVNMQLQYGKYGSALAAAAYGRGKDIVEYLVKEGEAEVNMRLEHGKYENALAAAIAGRGRGYKEATYNEIIEFLKKGQAEVNEELESGSQD